jgi:hypothetical protein
MAPREGFGEKTKGPFCPGWVGTNCPGRIVTLFTSQQDTASGILAAERVMFTMLYTTQDCPARRFFTMSSATLYRWSGIVLLAGSVLGVIGSILDTVLPSETAQQVLSTPFLIDASLFLAWALLLAMGLPGLYLRQAKRAGALGFSGFVLLSLGVLLGGVAFATVQVTIFPYLAQSAPKLLPSGGIGPTSGFVLWILGPGLLLAIGNILLGIATLRAHVFPRWAGILLIVAGVLSLASIPVSSALISLASNVVFFVALAWYGYLLMRPEREATVAMTHPATEVGAGR